MRVLTYGEIMDGGASVFHSVATLDDRVLRHRFEGVIRVDNPYRALKEHVDELKAKLVGLSVDEIVVDFSEFRFCNSNGFYVIMDLIEALYMGIPDAKVKVRRVPEDDWQRETLPILMNIDDDDIASRTTFEDVIA